MSHVTFTYRHEVNCGTEKGLSLVANVTHSCDALVVREMGRRCNYDRDQLASLYDVIGNYLENPHGECHRHRIEILATQSGFYSLVAVEYINKDNVHEFSIPYLERILELVYHTINHKSFPVVMIHDALI